MILTDAKGTKYWAHFRHLAEDLTATAQLIDPETGGRIHIPSSFVKADKQLRKKPIPQRMSVSQAHPVLLIHRTEVAFHEGPCVKAGKPPCGTPNTIHAFALCSPKEMRFDRNEGRKTALAEAMRVARLSREKREELWASYFSQRSKYEPYRKPVRKPLIRIVH